MIQMPAPEAVGPAIRVRALEKSYKDLQVLRGVDFDVAPGTIFALLGSNGAGKTTVVKILATLLRADAGTVTVNGFDVATHPADVRESISLTGQFAAVDEILSGRENLVLIARLRHLITLGKIHQVDAQRLPSRQLHRAFLRLPRRRRQSCPAAESFLDAHLRCAPVSCRGC